MGTIEKPAVDLDLLALEVPEPELRCDGWVDEGHGRSHRCPKTATHRAVLSCGHHYLICDVHVGWVREIIAEDKGIARCSDCEGDPWVTLITLEPIKG